MARKKTPQQLAKTKLESSGLSLTDAKDLGIKVVASASRVDKSMPAVPALHFIYHDLSGEPRKDKVCRVRLLEAPKGSFGEVDTKRRYIQPPETVAGVYLPRSIDWELVAGDPNIMILITEGELKAASACKLEMPTIGLGGVWSWRSAKLGWPLLPELEQIDWSRRDVVIMFDSDTRTNPDIAQATSALCQELSKRGALPRVGIIPSDGEEKVGLDDLIVKLGARAHDVVQEIVDQAEGDDLARQLWEFNGRFAYIMTPPMVYDEQFECSHKVDTFHRSVFANVWATQRVDTGEGSVKLKKQKVAEAWVSWPFRRQLARMTYEPGAERVVRYTTPRVTEHRLNMWAGFGVSPEKGDLTLWRTLVDHLFEGVDAQGRKWFEQWCLYPLKHPGAKLPTATALWSKEQGIGKSVVGKLLGRIYGSANYAEVSQDQLESQFNGWHVYKQFVMFDDVSAYDSRSKADVLKKMITEDTVTVNIKGIPTFEIPDRANFYLTSNKANALYLEDEDRRFFVHEVTSSKLGEDFWSKFYLWMGGTREHPELGPGPAAVLHYALEEMDFSGFKPYAPPPVTQSKLDMVLAAKGELEVWVHELCADPDSKLAVGEMMIERDLFTSSELIAYFDQERRGRPVTAVAMGLRLAEALPRASAGLPLRPNGRSERFYVVRNAKKWVRASRKEMEKHIKTHRAREQGNSGKKY